MPKLIFRSELACSVDRLRAFHHSSEALYRLTPPLLKLEIEGDDLTVRAAARFVTQTRLLWVRTPWIAVITHADEHGFHDLAEKSPFAAWSHWHRFTPHGKGSVLTDEIQYETSKGTLVDALAGLGIRVLFAYRHWVTRRATSVEVSPS